jgi:hypothetical protein
MEKQRGMAFGFRKAATAVIEPDRLLLLLLLLLLFNIPIAVHTAPPKDEQVVLETCTGC